MATPDEARRSRVRAARARVASLLKIIGFHHATSEHYRDAAARSEQREVDTETALSQAEEDLRELEDKDSPRGPGDDP